MDNKTIVTVLALAVMITVGYAAYTNGSINDLSNVINNQLSGITSVGSNYLGALVTRTSPAGSGNPSLVVSVNPGLKKSADILPAQTAVIFASYVLDAKRSNEDVAVFNLTLSPVVSKGGYIDDVRNCQLVSENNAIISNQVGTLFGKGVTFRLHNENADPATPNSLGFLVLKGKKSVINLKCDVAINPNSASGSVFKWWTVNQSGGSVANAIGMFSNKVATVYVSAPLNSLATTLRTVGDFSVSLDPSTKVGGHVPCGDAIQVIKLKVASSFEDVYVKQLGLALTGTAGFTAVTRFTLHDGNNPAVLGEGAFGTSKKGEANFNDQGFLVPAGSSKSIGIRFDLSADSPTNRCQVGKTFGVDYLGSYSVGAVTATSVVAAKNNTTRISSNKFIIDKSSSVSPLDSGLIKQ